MIIIETIHNIETNEISEIEREMTDKEIAAYEKEQSEIAARIAKLAEKEGARKAIFDKLGLTEEEAKLLLS